MAFLSALWLPILLSSVLVFLVSWILHVFLPLHKGDMKKLPDEARFLEALRAQGIAPGTYAFPRPSSLKDLASPELQARYAKGPVGLLTLRAPGSAGMGKGLLQWFVFTLVISVFVGYATWFALGRGAAYGRVFQLAGTIAILAHAVSSVQESIWKGLPWTTTAKFVFDGVVYGLVTAGAFAGFWPR